jgi:hypothetical protein
MEADRQRMIVAPRLRIPQREQVACSMVAEY